MFNRLDKFDGPIFEGAYVQNGGRGRRLTGLDIWGAYIWWKG